MPGLQNYVCIIKEFNRARSLEKARKPAENDHTHIRSLLLNGGAESATLYTISLGLYQVSKMTTARIVMEKFASVPESLLDSVQRTTATYRRLGGCGLRVSNPILGGLSFGSSKYADWVLNEDESLPLLQAAYERGINTWDTANTYSNGESERLIAKAITRYNIPRQKVVIMTKCFRPVCDYDPGSAVTMHHKVADRSKDYVNQWGSPFFKASAVELSADIKYKGLSRQGIYNAVEGSLRRLNTSYVDVLQIHRFDETVNPTETMSALHDLIRAGMVRYIGASSMWAYQFAILQHTADTKGFAKFVSMQNHYNLLYREEEREMNPYCNTTGVGLIPWSPLSSGRLARRPNAEDTLRMSTAPNGYVYGGDADGPSRTIVSRVDEIATRRGWPMSHVALAWLNKKVTAPIIGFSSIQRIDEALDARGKELTTEEEAYLEEEYVARPILGHA